MEKTKKSILLLVGNPLGNIQKHEDKIPLGCYKHCLTLKKKKALYSLKMLTTRSDILEDLYLHEHH